MNTAALLKCQQLRRDIIISKGKHEVLDRFIDVLIMRIKEIETEILKN